MVKCQNVEVNIHEFDFENAIYRYSRVIFYSIIYLL